MTAHLLPARNGKSEKEKVVTKQKINLNDQTFFGMAQLTLSSHAWLERTDSYLSICIIRFQWAVAVERQHDLCPQRILFQLSF